MSGSNLYDPDQAAVNTRWIQPWSESFRAQRDVGLSVPINFHTLPAVSLSQACFSTNQYEQYAFQKCFSNLLGVGFRRFAVDAYWDQLRSVWSLCPVEQPPIGTQSSSVSVVPGPTVAISTDTATARVPESTAVPLGGSLGFARRQDSSKSAAIFEAAPSVLTSPALSSVSPSTSAAQPTVISFPTTYGPPLLQIGRYNCTSLMTLNLLTGILSDFLKATSTTTGAAITILTFDVHAAYSISQPDGPAPQLSQDQLPESGTLLSDVLKGNLSNVMYTPVHLRDQRANLNNSWYNVDWDNLPLNGYFADSKNANGHIFTEDGWPTEAYMEFQELYRLVSSYGSVDPQMRLYNVGPDLDYMFPPGALEVDKEALVNSDGQLSSGCLFVPTEGTITTATNSSWAISSRSSISIGSNPDLKEPIASIGNLTSCGLTALLNQTLANTTADKNPLPYAAYVHSTLWSWAPGEPLNATTGSNSATANRCVIMTSAPYAGRWRVTDCLDRRHIACQDPSQPYNWQISSEVANIQGANSLCRAPFKFSIPHTALENAHLLAALQNHRQSNPNDDAVFIDLNALNVPDCWVMGLNGTCPYLSSTDTNRTRIVVVPTIAAVIIFVLAALTFFVKCAANRREDKRGRQRRVVDGWEYEGVPS